MSEGNGVAQELDIRPDSAADATRRDRLSEGGPHYGGPLAPIIEINGRLDALAQRCAELNTAFGQLRAYTLGLSNQQDMTLIQMERNARASAADLAIKGAPEAAKGDAEILTALAAAWLAWLKGGEQG